MKKVFLKDIAKNLNVSKTAVSLVLNGKGDENKISPDTQKRITEYAKEHNYVANQLARGLSRGKSETIGLIIPNISDTFYSKIAGFVEKKANEKGYTVLFSSSYEDANQESKLVQSMLNRQVEGLIIASTQGNKEDIKFLKNNNFPFVLIDRCYPDLDTNYVIVDNFGGLKAITEHLIKLGRKKIGFVTLEPRLEAIHQRFLGYKEALKNSGIPFNKKIIKELNTKDYEEQMPNVVRELVKFPNSVDSIVFVTHYLAAAGLRELKNMNIKVPQEVALVSFDQLAAFDMVDPPITSVIQPVKEIAYKAVEILFNTIDMKSENPEDKKVVDVHLEVRKSCGTF